jgi:aldehyde dehydrogenase family protein
MLAIRFPGVSRPAPSDEMQSFGPVIGVMKVASDEEAIRLMNYGSYGLTASVGSSLCPLDPGADLRAAVERVTIRCTTLEIQLAEGMAEDSSDRILVIPWTPPAPYRRREIIQGEGRRSASVRPMRAEARALLIDALRDAYCWQDEPIRDSSRIIESIAAREKKTEHSIRMTLSLAFLSPALVKAAIERRLSRGFGVKRLMDLPMSWSDQWSVLGLKAPAQT